MRNHFFILLSFAFLLFAGNGCLPDAQKQADGLNAIEDQPVTTARPLRLFNEDGEPVPGNIIRKTHVVGRSSCPDPIGSYIVDLGESLTGTYKLIPKNLPKWLSVRKTEEGRALVGRGVILGLDFNCNIADRSTHLETIRAGFALDCDGCLIEAGKGWKDGDAVDLDIVLDIVTETDADKR